MQLYFVVYLKLLNITNTLDTFNTGIAVCTLIKSSNYGSYL